MDRHVVVMMAIALFTVPLRTQGQERKPIADHVVVISIDGLRPDAIVKAAAPTLLALIKEGTYSPNAKTVRPSKTLPAHVSMLTGLDSSHHKVLHNEYKAGCVSCPTIMSIARKAGLSTAMLLSQDRFHYLVQPDSVDYLYADEPGKNTCDTTAGGIAKAFVEHWSERKFNFTFVHIKEPDAAGHSSGWMSAPYLEAVGTADTAVGVIVAAIKEAGRWERTVLIVTSDHGGSGQAHLDNTPENSTIPWICVGPRVRPGLTLARGVRIYDTAPTALALLGLPMPRIIDGRFLSEALTK